MAVSRDDYIIYGQKWPYDKELMVLVDDVDQYSRDREGDLMALVDGMNGEYIIIGKLLARFDEPTGIELNSYSLDDLKAMNREVTTFLHDLEVPGCNLKSAPPLSIHILTHWH